MRQEKRIDTRSWTHVIAFCLINEIRVTLINEDEAIRKPAEKLAFHLPSRMKILAERSPQPQFNWRNGWKFSTTVKCP